jgi:hypothetical protein
MSWFCFCSQSAQQGWQTSAPTLRPKSVGIGAYPSGGLWFPHRLHLIVSADILKLLTQFSVFSFQQKTSCFYLKTEN